MLAGEGWIVARGPIGTIVAPQLSERPGAPPPTRPVMRPAWSSSYATEISQRPFRLGLPALDAFPRKLWSRLVASEARALSPAGMAHPDPAGYGKLREEIAAYLAIARGIFCEPRQVFVTAGYQGALALASRAVIAAGDEVWFEDPGYYLARQALTAAETRLIPVRVDEEGMRIADGMVYAPRARFVVVTPSHQCPLGMTLSLPRRLALLSWAADVGAWVIEDDYDGEFHYAGWPLPALKSLDSADIVLYAGSFSKVLFPALRLGYMVVPDRLMETFARAASAFHAGNARLEQAVVARFMNEVHFSRHQSGCAVSIGTAGRHWRTRSRPRSANACASTSSRAACICWRARSAMRATPIWCTVPRATDWRRPHCRPYRSIVIVVRDCC